MKQGYLYLCLERGDQRNETLEGVWKLDLIPKIAIFWWTCLRNKILTMDNLKKRGFHLTNRCILYHKEEESVDHILLWFSYSGEVWRLLLNMLEVN